LAIWQVMYGELSLMEHMLRRCLSRNLIILRRNCLLWFNIT